MIQVRDRPTKLGWPKWSGVCSSPKLRNLGAMKTRSRAVAVQIVWSSGGYRAASSTRLGP